MKTSVKEYKIPKKYRGLVGAVITDFRHRYPKGFVQATAYTGGFLGSEKITLEASTDVHKRFEELLAKPIADLRTWLEKRYKAPKGFFDIY